MTNKTFSDSNALEDKLERIAALQQAIEQASQEVQTAAQVLRPEEQQVMLRILAQRRRLRQRAAQPALERAKRSTARASASASAWDEAAPRSLAGGTTALMQSVPWLTDARDLAMRRPVAVGLALGATLVIIGPKRLFRSVLWWTPFVWRSMRVAQRVNTTLRKR